MTTSATKNTPKQAKKAPTKTGSKTSDAIIKRLAKKAKAELEPVADVPVAQEPENQASMADAQAVDTADSAAADAPCEAVVIDQVASPQTGEPIPQPDRVSPPSHTYNPHIGVHGYLMRVRDMGSSLLSLYLREQSDLSSNLSSYSARGLASIAIAIAENGCPEIGLMPVYAEGETWKAYSAAIADIKLRQLTLRESLRRMMHPAYGINQTLVLETLFVCHCAHEFGVEASSPKAK